MTSHGALDGRRDNQMSDRRHLIRGLVAGVFVVAGAAAMLVAILWPMVLGV